MAYYENPKIMAVKSVIGLDPEGRKNKLYNPNPIQ